MHDPRCQQSHCERCKKAHPGGCRFQKMSSQNAIQHRSDADHSRAVRMQRSRIIIHRPRRGPADENNFSAQLRSKLLLLVPKICLIGCNPLAQFVDRFRSLKDSDRNILVGNFDYSIRQFECFLASGVSNASRLQVLSRPVPFAARILPEHIRASPDCGRSLRASALRDIPTTTNKTAVSSHDSANQTSSANSSFPPRESASASAPACHRMRAECEQPRPPPE